MRSFLPALLLLAVPALHAQDAEAPWYVGASLGLTEVSNVYRSANTNGVGPRSNDDQVRSASVLAGVRMHLGRQRLRLDLNATQNDYRRNAGLDYLGYSGTAAWDWQLGAKASGQVLLGSQRSLAPFNPGNAPITTLKNIERSDRARFYGRYGLVGPWSVDGGLTANRRDYSLALYDRYDYRQASADLGLRWTPSPDLSMRVAGRYGRGSYPRYQVLADGSYRSDSFRSEGLDLSADWRPSATQKVSGRVGATRNRYSQASAKAYKGGNGRVEWTWTPGSRLLLQASAARDSGDDSRLVDLGFFGNFNSSNSRVYDTLQLRAAYTLTAKISFDASASLLDRELTDSFGASSNTGSDRTEAASLGLRWAFARGGQFGCQWNADRRRGALEFSLPYSAHSFGCSVQYILS